MLKKSIFLEYLKSIIQEGTLNSSKSFSLVVSVLTGSILCICICFVMIYDVCTNGYLKTDINDLGIFLLCIGGYVAGGGINKALTENIADKRKTNKECNNDQNKK